ncbi:omega-hydroxypalmitate O-feruloyl transferase-like [Rhodamnia argentea]|uniref:Omega-hydroxypalmitate O-feruloyl transferase-like n=1 Tax=Rhodamnia argentea TaxID=178133 RepID=A0ABM3HUL1_9MYRT|nr:omega-hydroxypalmitate O-feruloyl transferase-like [Rhodamnia argentea]
MEAFHTVAINAPIVERSVSVAVLPEQETPGGSLFLSNIDQASVFYLPMVYSFDRSDADTVDVIKKALCQVLVHYYPLAGRLARNSQGKLTVDCEKKLGVPFVEASANCDIEDLGDMKFLDRNVLQKLVYGDATENTVEVAPLLTAQVTKFRCGGFTVGIAFNHCMFDGTSVMNFMNSWAEIARGRPLSIIPCHDRTVLTSRVPPQITGTSDSFVQISDVSDLKALYEKEQIVWKSFHFDNAKYNIPNVGDCVAMSKITSIPITHCFITHNNFTIQCEQQSISSCSSFVALAARVWRARTMALKMKPHQLSKLLFPVDFRSMMKPPMPRYIGNAVVEACCLCTVGELIDEPFSFTAGRIREAIERVNEDYVRSWIDSLDVHQFNLLSLTSLVLVSWQRFDYGSTDFGWGKPRTFGTGDLPTGCLFMADGRERKGIVVVLGLPLSAMDTFEKLVQLE